LCSLIIYNQNKFGLVLNLYYFCDMIQFTIKSTGQSIRTGWVIDREKNEAFEINQVTIDRKWVGLKDTIINNEGIYILKNIENEQTDTQ